jgi:hypothetical protein
MFEWLKRRNVEDSIIVTVVYLNQNAQGLAWSFEPMDSSLQCGALALPILQQLESDGLVIESDTGFISSWHDIYAIAKHPEYSQVCSDIQIPELILVSPALESIGTLTDKDFGVSISGWTNFDGVPLRIDIIAGPIIHIDGKHRLIPESSWKVVLAVNELWERPEDERNDISNRKLWGQIRQTAIAAKSQLSDFLFRSVVLTPEKLLIDLNRVDVSGTKVVEVIPSFGGCPEGWLNQFDNHSRIPDRYDIPTPQGLIQVIITPAVKAVLSQIKKMPARRVSGVRAEAFVVNPFAALGEDASATIDVEQFEQARIDANLTFDRFTAHVEKDPLGNPIAVGLLIERTGVVQNGIQHSSIKLFSDDVELERFIEITNQRVNKGFQISAWKDYEFELFGNTSQELDILSIALALRKKGFIQITYAQIYDISRYSTRIEEIGTQKPFFSPYIAKKDSDGGWFPENLINIISWSPNDDDAPIAIPITPELEKLITEKLILAEQEGANEITVPILPRPLLINEAKNILQSFNAFRKNPPKEPPDGSPDRESDPKVKGETLVIKANIQGIDYQEITHALLSNHSKTPIIPRNLKNNVKLMPHQKEGIAWLQHLFKHSPTDCRGCVLADDMGLGKTLQLLTLLAWVFEQDSSLPPALIVAPVSLLENWQEEINNFFAKDSLAVAVVYGEYLRALRLPRASIDSQLIENGLVKFLKPGWKGSANIVLTTYETLRDLEFSFAAETWSVMICDEAQKIKNPNALVTTAAKKQNVQFKIACTGTPVENSLTDLWCLFDFVQPGLLGGLNEFGRTYRKPIEAKTDEEKSRIAELRKKIEPLLKRRTKADVANLKAKIIVEECQQLPISLYQVSIYSQAITLFNQRNVPGNRSPFKNHLGLLQYLRVICTDPRNIGTEASTLESLASYRKRAPKLDWLINELYRIKERHEKVIVFCEFRGVQRLLKHYINEAFGVTPDVINGDTEASASHQNSRQKKIRAFQDKPGFGVIVLSPIAVGYGVNIQAANHVIHYTRTWNPAKEDQATDRAYRIGQEKEVYVYYPVITSNEFTTFEVKLHQLLEYKREIAGDMLNGSGDISSADFDISRMVPLGDEKIINPVINLDYVLTISPKYLEGLTAALWQAQGYSVVYRTPDSGDDGVDVVALNSDGKKGVLIQCKSSVSDSRDIAWDAIKDVVTGKASYELRHPGVEFDLVCLTNQRFNAKAKEQATLNNVSIVEQDDINLLLKKYNKIAFLDVENFVFN